MELNLGELLSFERSASAQRDLEGRRQQLLILILVLTLGIEVRRVYYHRLDVHRCQVHLLGLHGQGILLGNLADLVTVKLADYVTLSCLRWIGSKGLLV